MAQAAHAEHSNNGAVKEIWIVTAILTVLTIVELAIGFYMMDVTNPKTILFLKGAIVILMMVKAFYIVGYFMHLKHELKNLIMTIVVPLTLFIWFIAAFLYDGNSYKNLRNTYDPYKKAQTTIKVEKKKEGHAEHGSETHKTVE
ncbi:MAG: cytochrome C oxidase subunit IV family protein [Flavobacterium sp.]|nr:cytochrome C oxidase subunit IV family protein [Flavobacterium sp.]